MNYDPQALHNYYKSTNGNGHTFKMPAKGIRSEFHDLDDDPTLRVVNKVKDPNQWAHITRNVPVFVPHRVYRKETGDHLYTVDAKRLRKIADGIMENQRRGKFVKLYDRHSSPVAHMSQTNQPRLMGIAANPKVGHYGEHNELALKLDFFFPWETWEDAKELGERSAEFKPSTDGMPAVALLKTEPRLKMGQVHHYADFEVMYDEVSNDGLAIYQVGTGNMQQGLEMFAGNGQMQDGNAEYEKIKNGQINSPRPPTPQEQAYYQQQNPHSQRNVPPQQRMENYVREQQQRAWQHQQWLRQQQIPQQANYWQMPQLQQGETDLNPECKNACDQFIARYGQDPAVANYMMNYYQANFPPSLPTNAGGINPGPGMPMPDNAPPQMMQPAAMGPDFGMGAPSNMPPQQAVNMPPNLGQGPPGAPPAATEGFGVPGAGMEQPIQQPFEQQPSMMPEGQAGLDPFMQQQPAMPLDPSAQPIMGGPESPPPNFGMPGGAGGVPQPGQSPFPPGGVADQNQMPYGASFGTGTNSYVPEPKRTTNANMQEVYMADQQPTNVQVPWSTEGQHYTTGPNNLYQPQQPQQPQQSQQPYPTMNDQYNYAQGDYVPQQAPPQQYPGVAPQAAPSMMNPQQFNYANENNHLRQQLAALQAQQQQNTLALQRSRAEARTQQLLAAGKQIDDPQGFINYMATLTDEEQNLKATEVMQNYKDTDIPPIDYGSSMVPIATNLVAPQQGQAPSQEAIHAFGEDDIDSVVNYMEEQNAANPTGKQLDPSNQKDYDAACQAVMMQRYQESQQAG